MANVSNQNDTVAHIVVFGNEKGGCGKSTAAMHATIALLRMGFRVGTIDLDARQGTFTRYLRNRFQTIMRERLDQPMPTHMPIAKSEAGTLDERNAEDTRFLFMALEELTRDNDIVIIDTPGADTPLNRLAHSIADTLVTPVNDSLIDLDMLADIDPDSLDIKGPSVYATQVMAQREARRMDHGRPLNWVVMRNRLNPLNTRSKQTLDRLMSVIAGAFGCHYIPGFSERLIFRDLFLKGLTLLDLEGIETGEGMTMSQLAARQEVRTLINAIVPQHLRFKLIKRKRDMQQQRAA